MRPHRILLITDVGGPDQPREGGGSRGWDFKPILAALLAYSVAFISKIKAHQNTKGGKERNIQIIKFKSLKNLLGVWVQIQRVPSHDMARDQSHALQGHQRQSVRVFCLALWLWSFRHESVEPWEGRSLSRGEQMLLQAQPLPPPSCAAVKKR